MRRAFERISSLGVVLVVVLEFAVFGLTNRTFLTPGNIANLLVQCAPLVIASVGQTLVIIGGGLDISIGSVAALASVTGAIAAVHFGVAAGVAAFVAAGIAVGLINGLCVGWLKLSPVITTISTLTLASGAAFQITDGQPVSGLPPQFIAFGFGSIGGVADIVILALIVVVAADVLTRFTPVGLALRAVGGNADSARLLGLSVVFYRFLPFALAGLTTGLAALVYSSEAGSGQPTLGNGLQLSTIAAAVIGGASIGGGRGSIWGAALGALFVTALSTGMILAGTTPFVQQIILGFALIVAVLWDYFRRWLERIAADAGARLLPDPSSERSIPNP